MTKFFDRSFWKVLKVNKEGILLGSLAGFIAAWYVRVSGVNFLFAADSTGLLDLVTGSLPPLDQAFAKLVVEYVILGAMVGFVMDALIKPNK